MGLYPEYFDKYKQVMNTNLNSVVYLTHKCVEYLSKTKGNIINISSIAGIQTVNNLLDFSQQLIIFMSKH